MDFVDSGFLSDGNLKIDSGEKIDEVILLLNLEAGDPLYIELSNTDQLKAGRAVDIQCFSFLGIMFTIVALSPFDSQSFDSRKRIARAVLHWILKQA